jgi:asparagine synthase (glutamine-hydrolysing)
MSILFGVCQPEGNSVEERHLAELGQATARSAPDGTYVAARGRIGMGYQPYHTHLRSNLEAQPTVDELGNMLTLDGRIDNYAELCELLDIEGLNFADSQIVSAAFRRWGPECFSKLIGDWALALWSHRERMLYLARDHVGTRTVYFEDNGNRILWSTSLETFLATGDRRELDQAYAACYLSCRPIGDLTPYKGIRAVTPAHYVIFHEGRRVRRPHWQWLVKDRIIYKSDAEYEEHFLSLFRQSVERRTGPGAPILAQLSGGMDSTSIVCMSDRVRTERGGTPEDLLDTISYYDASEPNWDERPYFSAVEAKRRKQGIHLSVSAQERTFEPPSLEHDFAPSIPGIDGYALERERQFEGAVAGREYRVILSGIGGDEILGGVPDPLPELADHLVSLRLSKLISKSMVFGLPDRRPLVHMLGRTAAYSLNSYLRLDRAGEQVPPWVSPRLKQIADGHNSYPPSDNGRYGLSPSSINNGKTWWLMLETLPHLYPSVLSRREYRYPYLDRDLVDFLFRIPREQLVRPGRRRSLMRRALVGMVPIEVLERRRKASLIRGPLLSLRRGQSAIAALFLESSAEAMGFVDAECLRQTLAAINKGTTPKWWPAIISAANFEFWLAGKRNVLGGIPSRVPQR